MIPDSYITELRLKAVRELPWPIPAAVLLEMRDVELDHPAAASNDEYWHVLNAVVRRIESRSATGDRPSEEAA